MKRASLLFLILFLVPSLSSAFVENRHQWWEIRLKNINLEKSRLDALNTLDPRVLQLLEREAARARDIIATLETDMRNDGSLTHEERVFSEADIASEAGRVVPPLFALTVMELLARGPGSAESRAVAREAVSRRLRMAIAAALGREDDELARQIMAEEIRPADWKRISDEIIMGRLMAGWKDEEERARREVAALVREELRAKRNTSNGMELRRMTLNAAMEHLRTGVTQDNFTDIGGSLERAWSWRLAQSSIDRELAAHVKSLALMERPERAHRFYKKPLEADSMIFRARHSEYALENKSGTSGPELKGAGIIMIIPELPSGLSALAEMDGIRTSALRALNGREDRKFFEETAARLHGVVERHTAATRDAFFREEEKARLSSREGRVETITNEPEFAAARKLFYTRVSLLNAYRQRSLEFLNLVSEARRIESGDILAEYRYRTARCRDYMQFAVDLAKGCGGLSRLDDTRLHGRFRAVIGTIGPLFQFVGSSLNLENRHLPYLVKSDIAALRALKSESIGTVHSMRGEIRAGFMQYGGARSRTGADAKAARTRLEKSIAQAEIDVLAKHASECAALYGDLAYGGEALDRYLNRFNSLHAEATGHAISEDLEYAVRMGSLFTRIDDFDRARIDREYLSKRYLVHETRATLARLATMLQFYRKNGTAVQDAPDDGEIDAIEKLIGTKTAVKIDAWEMNEANIAEIDRKAAAKLSSLLRRRAYAPLKKDGGQAEAPVDRGTTVRLKEPGITLSFPRGWEEGEVGEVESLGGVMKIFRSADSGSLIRLVALPLEDGDSRRTAEGWIRKSGASPVEKSRGKTGEVEYVRILSRDRDRNISETCCMEMDGYAFLVSGTTSRSQYMKFRIQLGKIIDSIQPGSM